MGQPGALPCGAIVRTWLALRGAAAEGGVHGLDADPRRLGLGHAELLEDVQRLPEEDPRRVGPLCAERRFRQSFEDLGFLVGVTDLPGHPESGAVMIGRLVVPADPRRTSAILRSAISCWDMFPISSAITRAFW